MIAKGTPAYRRATLAMFLLGFTTFSLLYWPQSLLPMMTRHWQISAGTASSLVSLGTLAMALMLIPASVLSDRLGRRRVMLPAMILASLLTVAMSWATSFHHLLLLRFAAGVLLAGLPAVAMTYLAEEIEAPALTGAMGLYVSGTAIGGMSGRLLSASAAETWGSDAAAGVVGLSGLLAALAFGACLPPSRHFQPRPPPWSPAGRATWRRVLLRPVLWRWWLIGFLLLGCFVSLYNVIGFRLELPPFEWGPLALGSLFLLYVFGGAASAAAGRLSRRWGEGPLLQTLWLAMMVGVVLTLSHQLIALIAGMAIFTLGFFAAHALASTAVGRAAEGQQSLASSLYLTCYYAGASLLGPVVSHAWQGQDWGGVVLLLVMALLVGASLSHVATRTT